MGSHLEYVKFLIISTALLTSTAVLATETNSQTWWEYFFGSATSSQVETQQTMADEGNPVREVLLEESEESPPPSVVKRLTGPVNFRKFSPDKKSALKLLKVPSGTLVSLPSDTKLQSYKLMTESGVYEFAVGIRVVYLPAKHGLSAQAMEELREASTKGELLVVARALESATQIESQQDMVGSVKEGGYFYDGPGELTEEALDDYTRQVFPWDERQESIRHDLPDSIKSLPFDEDVRKVTYQSLRDWEKSEQAVAIAQAAETGAQKRIRGRKLCYRFVKEALARAKAVEGKLVGGSARQAGRDLEKQGYVNIYPMIREHMDSLYDAPMGSILVYDGGRHGHVEVKTAPMGQPGFAAQIARPYPRTGPDGEFQGRGRWVTGIYLKVEF